VAVDFAFLYFVPLVQVSIWVIPVAFVIQPQDDFSVILLICTAACGQTAVRPLGRTQDNRLPAPAHSRLRLRDGDAFL
jgi:hypothetical protein